MYFYNLYKANPHSCKVKDCMDFVQGGHFLGYALDYIVHLTWHQQYICSRYDIMKKEGKRLFCCTS